jgi:hypothetical protein
MKTITPPKPHIPKNPRAFVLGCDPTAFDKNGKRLEFETVFDIDKDQRYFAGILANLNGLGLDRDDVYIQNLVTEYLDKETSKNKKGWMQKARESIAGRKAEFDRADPGGKWPVFLTSWLLYDALLNDDLPRKSPAKLYESTEIISPSQNKLGRPLIPLFRHYEYGYKKKLDYFKKLREFFRKE